MRACPFCGGTKIYPDGVTLDEVVHHFWVCRGCGCEGPHDPDEALSRVLWNVRAVTL